MDCKLYFNYGSRHVNKRLIQEKDIYQISVQMVGYMSFYTQKNKPQKQKE